MNSQDNSSFWQRFAKFYGPAMQRISCVYRDICRRIALRLKPDMDVLELACGSGQLSFPLAERVHLWEATDFSSNMIEQAGKQPAPSQLHFSVQNAESLSFSDNSFDAVVIGNALHVMPKPELALAEVRRVLKPGGLLFAPNFLRPVSNLEQIHLRFLSLIGFRIYHSWDEVQYNAFLHSQGFSVVEECVLGRGFQPVCYVVAQTETDP